MPSTPANCGPVRSATAINDEIRELAMRSPWTDAERARYERLLTEWAGAVRVQAAAGAA